MHFAKFLLAAIVLTTTACAPFWQVNRIEEKVDRLVASTNRSTLSEIFGEQTENVMRKMESLSEEERYKLDQLLSEYEKAFKFYALFVVSAPKFTLIDAR